MSRWLVMAEQAVTESERQGYLQVLAVRRARATAASVNFWVFEQSESRGHFLEFFEAGSREVLQAVLDAESEARAKVEACADRDVGAITARVVWREVAQFQA